MELMTAMAQKIDDENQALMKQNNDLKIDFLC